MARKLFVTGIGTDVGKTIASAILTEAWQADYWKPIQAGNLDTLESETVASLVSNATSRIHPTKILLTTPASPHYSAEIDQVEIDVKDFQIPHTTNNLIIEGAGGLMVPINRKSLLFDWIVQQGFEIILVSRHYLGSINHTLLSIEVLKKHQIPIAGIIFNDDDVVDSASIISTFSQCPVIMHIPKLHRLDPESIRKVATSCRKLQTL